MRNLRQILKTTKGATVRKNTTAYEALKRRYKNIKAHESLKRAQKASEDARAKVEKENKKWNFING